MSTWWEELEIALREQSEDAPDPWASIGEDDGDESPPDGLTSDQETFLRQLAEQPRVGRFDVDDE